MIKLIKTIIVGIVAIPSIAFGLPVDVPRNDVFVADQIFRYNVIDNFNFWIIKTGGEQITITDNINFTIFKFLN